MCCCKYSQQGSRQLHRWRNPVDDQMLAAALDQNPEVGLSPALLQIATSRSADLKLHTSSKQVFINSVF